MFLPNSLEARDVAAHLHPQTDMRRHEAQGPLVIERGDGVRVVDSDGRAYIEGVSGLWCANLGFSERRLADAAHEQLCRLPYQQTFAHRSNPQVIELAERLLAKAPVPMSKVMFQNSGSEAVDTAIKFVWYYHTALGRPEKRRILSREGSYHGTSVASASLTGLPNMHRGWGLPLDGFIHVESPHFWRHGLPGESEASFALRLAESLEARILREDPDTIGAFFVEPVMGTGGVILPPADYFDRIQAICAKYDILLVVDEVICGFGRTGNYWGSETFGLRPDMLTCAKGLSAAYFPISGLMINDRVYQVLADRSSEFGGFGQGYTYGGHPVGAAVALETLKIYDEIDVVAVVRSRQEQMQDGLQAFAAHPLVGEVRGIGMMGALQFVSDKTRKAPFDTPGQAGAAVAAALSERGVLLRALGDTLVMAPPLIISEADLATILTAFGEALDSALRTLGAPSA